LEIKVGSNTLNPFAVLVITLNKNYNNRTVLKLQILREYYCIHDTTKCIVTCFALDFMAKYIPMKLERVVATIVSVTKEKNL